MSIENYSHPLSEFARTIPIMIEKLGFTENQRFQFERFKAAHNVL